MVFQDYYEMDNPGCCLICERGYEGCLCYSCKCSKCCWYSKNHPDGIEYYDEENMKETCVIAVDMQIESNCRYEDGQKESELKISIKKMTTKKAVLCTLKDVKNHTVSDKEFWVPKAALAKSGFIKEWFAGKEVRTEFNQNLKSQKTLF